MAAPQLATPHVVGSKSGYSPIKGLHPGFINPHPWKFPDIFSQLVGQLYLVHCINSISLHYFHLFSCSFYIYPKFPHNRKVSSVLTWHDFAESDYVSLCGPSPVLSQGVEVLSLDLQEIRKTAHGIWESLCMKFLPGHTVGLWSFWKFLATSCPAIGLFPEVFDNLHDAVSSPLYPWGLSFWVSWQSFMHS